MMNETEIKEALSTLSLNMYEMKPGGKEAAAEAGLALLGDFLLNVNRMALALENTAIELEQLRTIMYQRG